MSDTQPGAGRKQAGPGRLALIAEATKRAGLIWITVPGPGGTGPGGADPGGGGPGGAGPGGGGPGGADPGGGGPGGGGPRGAGLGRPRPVWHVWRDAAYVLTGPGEQEVPGLGDAGQVTVAVPSKDTGGLLLRWTARVTQVEPGSAEWSGIIGALLAGRLNEPASPGESPAGRWARTGQVYRLTPGENPDTERPGA